MVPFPLQECGFYLYISIHRNITAGLSNKVSLQEVQRFRQLPLLSKSL